MGESRHGPVRVEQQRFSYHFWLLLKQLRSWQADKQDSQGGNQQDESQLIPDQVFSDTGQSFSSLDFENFAAVYGFECNTSSPNYPQSNGKVENAVKTAKNLTKKAIDSQSDPYLALLAWINTPYESVNSSPALRIYGRRTKTWIPTSVQLLKPQLPAVVEQNLRKNKAKQSFYYDRGSTRWCF